MDVISRTKWMYQFLQQTKITFDVYLIDVLYKF
jgi:hypothetical protein